MSHKQMEYNSGPPCRAIFCNAQSSKPLLKTRPKTALERQITEAVKNRLHKQTNIEQKDRIQVQRSVEGVHSPRTTTHPPRPKLPAASTATRLGDTVPKRRKT